MAWPESKEEGPLIESKEGEIDSTGQRVPPPPRTPDIYRGFRYPSSPSDDPGGDEGGGDCEGGDDEGTDGPMDNGPIEIEDLIIEDPNFVRLRF